MDLGVNILVAPYGADNKPLFPTRDEIDYFAAQGSGSIRLALDWQALQPQLGGALDASYLAQMHTAVAAASQDGLKVIIDLHNFGSYNGSLIGSAQTPIAAFANVWGQLGSQFASNGNVVFGLMNEPQVTDEHVWLSAVNTAIAAIRSAGATSQEVLVPGLGWDGAATWTANGNAAVLGAPGAIVDPSNNYAFEVHQYLDYNGSGQGADVASSSTGVERLQSVTQWARETGSKLFLGEFGVTSDATPLAALNNMLSYMQQNSDVWQGGTYWAAGLTWNHYMYGVEPAYGLLNTPQMNVLNMFGDAHTAKFPLGDGSSILYTTVGAGKPAMNQVLDSSGHLVSVSLYGANGNLDRTLIQNADGTLALSLYDGTGRALPTTIQTYNAQNALLSQATVAADGSRSVASYVPTSTYWSSTDQYASDGKMTSELDYNYDGSFTSTAYASGHKADIVQFDSNWAVTSQTAFNADGTLASVQTNESAGGHLIKAYSEGVLATTTAYDASWSVDSQISLDALGDVTSTLTVLSDHSYQINAYTPGSTQIACREVFDKQGRLESQTALQADGTYTESDFVSGSNRLSSTTHLDAGMKNVLDQTTYDAQGFKNQMFTNRADGSHTIATYNVQGSDHPSTVATFDAAWHQQSIDILDGSGVVKTRVTSGTDRIYESDFAAGPSSPLTSSEVYDANWHLLSQVNYDQAGLVTGTRNDNADGSHTISAFDMHGSANPSTVTIYDAVWHPFEVQQFSPGGSLASIDHIAANGTNTVQMFAAGDPTNPTSTTIYDSSWHRIG